MAINNNLYPPIIDSYMPAFLADSGICKIYFSLSNFNKQNDIENVQVAIFNQNTNSSVLNKTKYPSEIMLTTLSKDENKIGDDCYYIQINASDLMSGAFLINQYYKVQIRFTGTSAAAISLSTPQSINAWLAANQQYFSEWSTICLIRGISTPVLSIKGFDSLGTEVVWNTENIKLIGKIDFADYTETETLKSYRIKLYKRSDNSLLIDSGILYPTSTLDKNSFEYTFKYYLEDNTRYYFTIDYTTQNLYSETNTYYVTADRTSPIAFTVSSFTAEADPDNGRMILNVKGTESFNDTLAFLRASSETNFTIWEDIKSIELNTETSTLDYTCYDYTVESGILYKYGVQRRHLSTNTQSDLHKTENPQGVNLEDCFLTVGDKQLKLQFDVNISSMKRTISDSKVETLGSPFPFIKRNGIINYRTFPISGLVTFIMDEEGLFATKEDIYGTQNIIFYSAFETENNITDFNNTTYEREFRKKVSQFLSKDELKLFRSPTEGNILIRLTDINFSPNTALGRHIWSFSGTAYEMDDCSIDNYIKYGIIKMGE